MFEQLPEILLKSLQPEQLLTGEPMSRHTTFRVGGPADYLMLPRDAEEVRLGMEAARSVGAPCWIVGNGSNLIVRDGGLRGLTILLGEAMGQMEGTGGRLVSGPGALLSQLANEALRRGLTGLEFASGIPGSVGGGVAMNAGAYGGQLSDVLVGEWVLVKDQLVHWTGEEMQLSYRSTRALREGAVVVKAEFQLQAGDPEAIGARMRELNRRRREKQPLHLPSAGSVFKRPEGHFAGGLIEQTGLKGLTVGGAQVSELHAGFIVNAGGATARDILELVDQVKRRVLERTGVCLEMEVRVLGED